MSKRLFIGVGTWKYQHESHLDLPEVKVWFEKVAALFTGKLGYKPALVEVSANPPSGALRDQLDSWFAAGNCDDSDWIVLYYIGHGKLDSGNLYLLTSNYRNELTPSTAFAAAEIGAMLVSQNASGESRPAQRVLLILDTCFSGASTFAFAEGLKARFNSGGLGPMFYMIASALPTEEAVAGGFARALIDALEDRSVGGSHAEFIYLDELVPAINQRLQFQRAVRLTLDAPIEPPRFFPNVRWVPDAPLGATVEEIHQFVERSEYLAHWNPTSRGVEVATQTGDFFTGRERAMTEIANWLSNPSDSRMCIVTGAPGCGKSAILSRIITCADGGLNGESPVTAGWRRVFREQIFDLAIHAKGKTLDEMVARVARHLDVQAELSVVLGALKDRERSFRLLIDALDEAREPARIGAEFLRPLQSIPRTKVLVGTRKEWLPSLGPDALILYVDGPEYLERHDLAKYVEARLGGTSPARRALAQAVAEKAYPNFLIARLVAEDLRSRKRLPSLSKIHLPASVSQAFEQYLKRFGGEKKRVEDLLMPLAWAEGGGLPWSSFWAPMASAIAGENFSYENKDIEWLLDHAGSFVIETLESGRSVYRLYHQSLADLLREGRNAQEIQQAIVTGLLTTIPFNEHGRDWFNAHPYIRVHLAEHAAAAGTLPDLMTDPGFLLAADCTRLLGAINASTVPLPTRLVQAYKAASIHLRSKPPAEAAAYLALSARQNGMDWQPPTEMPSPWNTLWADWLPAAPNTVIAVGRSVVTALQIAEWSPGQAVAIVGREDGDVEVWDIAANFLLANWHSAVGQVKEVALANTGKERFVVAVRNDSTLFVHAASSDKTRIVETGSIDEDSITALAVVFHNGEWICATAHYNLRLALRNLPDLTLKEERLNATGGTIYALAVVDYKGRRALLSGGDSLRRHVDSPDDSVLRLWSLDDLRLFWKDERGLDKGYIRRIQHGTFLDRNLAIVTGILRGEIWDLDRGEILYEQPKWSGQWLLYRRGEQTLLLADEFGKKAVFAAEMQGPQRQITLHPTPQVFSVEGEMLTGITRTQGHDVILSGRGHNVRVWDVEEMLRGPLDPTSLRSLHCLGLIPGQALCIGLGDEVVFKNVASGSDIFRLAIPPVFPPRAFVDNHDVANAIVYSQELSRLFVATYHGKILRIDPSHPSDFAEILDTRENIQRLRVVQWQGHTLGLSSGRSGGRYSARVWDLQTGQELFADRRFRLSGGEEDKPLYGLAAMEIAGDLRFAFAGQYGKIMVANFVSNPKSLQDFDEWRVPFYDRHGSSYTRWLETGREDGTDLLAAGTEHGDLVLWDYLTGEVLAKKRHAHRGYVNALAMREGSGRTLLLSAGDDGFLQVWNTDFEKLAEIEISEPIHAAIWLGEECIAAGTSRGVVAIQFPPNKLP